MTERVQASPGTRNVVRTLLRLSVTAAAAVAGAKGVSSAVTRAWIGGRALDATADTLTRTVR